jgi:hypothetical protein
MHNIYSLHIFTVELVGVIKEVFDLTIMHGIEYFLIDRFLPRLIGFSEVFQSSSSIWPIIQHYVWHPVVKGSEMQSPTSSTQNPSSSALNNKSQPCNCSIIRRRNAAERARPEAKMWKIPPMDCLAVG